MELAPVVLFVYARPQHTKKTLEALQKNDKAESTDLIIYSDAPRSLKDEKAVNEVREIIDSVSGFKRVSIIKRKENHGLAKNIIEGVTAVCEQYGKVIVLEDDIVTSPSFLNFMNAALERYQYDQEVWHISGWNMPVSYNSTDDAYFWRAMNCWGWATWQDRWKHYRKEAKSLIKEWTKEDINKFNLDGHCNFWSQVIDNESGKLNTWAIFWYATIFKNQGVCLNPTLSFVNNIGNDGSGENCDNVDLYKGAINNRLHYQWPTRVAEERHFLSINQAFYRSLRPSIVARLKNKLKVFLK